MNTVVKSGAQSARILAGAAVLFFAGCAGMGGTNNTQVTLSGAQEVPPVTTAATGFGTITVGGDKSVSGSVTTSGVVGVAAHIHDGAPGKNGPVIVPMTKSSDNTWTIPPGSKFTERIARGPRGASGSRVQAADDDTKSVRKRRAPLSR